MYCGIWMWICLFGIFIINKKWFNFKFTFRNPFYIEKKMLVTIKRRAVFLLLFPIQKISIISCLLSQWTIVHPFNNYILYFGIVLFTDMSDACIHTDMHIKIYHLLERDMNERDRPFLALRYSSFDNSISNLFYCSFSQLLALLLRMQNMTDWERERENK